MSLFLGQGEGVWMLAVFTENRTCEPATAQAGVHL